jgi:methyl-accepting chemotaxis protein
MTSATISVRSKQVQGELDSQRREYSFSVAKYIAWLTAIVTVGVAILYFFLPAYKQILGLAFAALFAFVTTGLHLFFFHRRDEIVVGTTVYALGVLIAAAAALVLMPSLMLAIGIAFIMIVILSDQILGEKARGINSFAGILLLASLLLLHFRPEDWFPPLNETVDVTVSVLLSGAAFGIVVVIVRLLILEQQQSFIQARETGLEIEERAYEERAQREYLQRTVEQYREFMARVAQGDLSARLSLEAQEASDDPLVLLGQSLNETTASLQQMITQIRTTADNLASAASEILAATTQQSAGATEQSTAISQASTTIDEVRTIADQTVQRAESVADLALRTAQVSQAGQQAVAETIEGMHDVQGKSESVAKDVLALSDQAQSIGGIITTVSEIANQSNMLALNAAVEAARAGERGKGFAVVAQEVRSLAEQSRAATQQIEEILSQIQSGVNTAVMTTEESMKGAASGVHLTQAAGTTIDQLAESVTASTQSATQIAAAARQQLTGMEQIAQAMDNIRQVAAQSVASTRQVEQTTRELNALAGQLRELVEQYQL